MKGNPYTLSFGKEPNQLISRIQQENEVIETFTSEKPGQQIYMITGVRGAGKTVFMTNIINQLKNKKDWICVELSAERDLLKTLASKLSSDNELSQLFFNAKINLSFFGFGVEIKNTAPITDIEIALSKMIETLKKQGKHLLISVDEVSNSQYIREFTSVFQILIRQDLPIFLQMTGLYQNISELQNEKTLTFLYRAPKIKLTSLNLNAIANNYQKNFHCSAQQANEMAHLTKGYSFAFQVLGHLTWKYDGDYKKAIPEYQQYLEELCYEKMWSELSEIDKKVMFAIASTGSSTIQTIREACDMSTNQFNPYRKRLILKGLIDGSQRGHVYLTLPLFKEFILANVYYE
jgi:hypothetical protein